MGTKLTNYSIRWVAFPYKYLRGTAIIKLWRKQKELLCSVAISKAVCGQMN